MRNSVVHDVVAMSGYAKASVKSLLGQVDAPIAVTTAFLALLSSFWTLTNLVLMFVLVGMILLDLLTGTAAAWKLGFYNGKKLVGGFIGKLLRLSIVIVAALLDLALAASLPDTAVSLADVTLTFKAATFALILAEGASILENVQKSEGDLPVIRVVMRALDRLNRGGEEPPMRRHYDPDAELLERQLRVEKKDGA